MPLKTPPTQPAYPANPPYQPYQPSNGADMMQRDEALRLA